jgi:hypothetical protein
MHRPSLLSVGATCNILKMLNSRSTYADVYLVLNHATFVMLTYAEVLHTLIFPYQLQKQ